VYLQLILKIDAIENIFFDQSTKKTVSEGLIADLKLYKNAKNTDDKQSEQS